MKSGANLTQTRETVAMESFSSGRRVGARSDERDSVPAAANFPLQHAAGTGQSVRQDV
jgi:hypothetical protein